MDAIVVAGGTPEPDDPLYQYTHGGPRVLIKIGGCTMLEHVIDALQSSSQVEEIVVVGLGHDHGQTFKRPVHHLPDHGSLVANATAGIEWMHEHNPTPRHVLGVSADIPTITAEIVDHLIETCHPLNYSLYYTVVTQDVLEKRFPNSKRTFVRLKDHLIAGGDMCVLHTSVISANPDTMKALNNARKHAWKLARIVGFKVLIKFLFRRLSIPEIEEAGAKIINGPVKVVLSPHAELAMDADKPHQVEQLRAAYQ